MSDYLSRRKFLILTGIGLLSVPVVLSACSTTKMSDQKTQKELLAKLRAEKKYKEVKIEVGDNFFSPKETTIEPGTIVIWTNKGRAIHDVMWDPNNDKDLKLKSTFTSDTMGAGDIHVLLFEEPGQYRYYCHYHGGPGRGQWGSVTVSSTDRTP